MHYDGLIEKSRKEGSRDKFMGEHLPFPGTAFLGDLLRGSLSQGH